MYQYLNPRLTLEECDEIQRQKMANIKELIEQMRKNAETLPPELRSQYNAVVTPLITLLF